MALIPNGLSLIECEVYERLIRVAKQRRERGLISPRPIVVITDVGKDYDDVSALTVLKELHRLRLVELRAVVANLMPADKRARSASAALNSLGLRDLTVPVARGTRGSLEDHAELAHEFRLLGTNFSSSLEYGSSHRDGQDLLRNVYQTAKEKGEKLCLLCLSSLQDIHEFASTHCSLVAECTAEVHMQGGNFVTSEGKLEPDCRAANNRFNLPAAREWHNFIVTNAIPSHTYTKVASFAASLTSDVFVELEATGHPIGAYLRRAQVEQDLAFYGRACESDPEKRFAPFMDQTWFLANKTNWHQQRVGNALPTGKEVIPFLTKLVLYDVHAALGAAGEDVLAELKMFQGRRRCIQVDTGVVQCHKILCDDQSTMAREEVDAAVVAVSALLKGSLRAVQQGLPSENSVWCHPDRAANPGK